MSLGKYNFLKIYIHKSNNNLLVLNLKVEYMYANKNLCDKKP